MRRQWAHQETTLLIQFTEAGLNAKTIAKLIGRSYPSTVCKRNRLGYRFYPPKDDTPRQIIFVSDIQKTVAKHFNVPIAEMTSGNRRRAFARPRQVAMFLARELTCKSYPHIGNLFGGKHHTTVIHGKRQLDRLLARDERLSIEVEAMKAELVASAERATDVDKSHFPSFVETLVGA